MVDSRLQDIITEEKVRDALGRNFGSYDRFSVADSWQSGHAVFGRVVLSKGRGNKLKQASLVAKAFVQPTECFDPSYTISHDPSLLFQKETASLGWVSRILTDVSDKPRCYPLLYGNSSLYRLLVTEDLGAGNKKQELVVALNGDKSELEKVFVGGIKTVARFVGRCRAHAEDFRRTGLYTLSRETQAADLALLVENVARIFYNAVQNRPEEQRPTTLRSGEYSSEIVLDYLRNEKSFDLKARLKEIEGMRPALNADQVFQHNDCNGLNIVGDKLVDFEKFGLGSWTSDISSYCIIVGVGNNVILRRDAFSHFRHLYLAYEHAYATDPDKVKVLEGYKNGEFKKFVSEHMDQKRYTDWTMSFFADAIYKNLQLCATLSRYEPEISKTSTGSDDADLVRPVIFDDITELLETVAGLSGYFQDCTNQKEVRDYFWAFGKLLFDLGLYSGTRGKNKMETALQHIKGASIAAGVMEDWPYKKS